MTRPDNEDTQRSPVTTDHGAAGGIEVDRQGNRVWRWARDIVDSTSILLKRLENHDLKLEPTQKVPVMDGGAQRGAAPAAKGAAPAKTKERLELSLAVEAGGRDKTGGFDPYNSKTKPAPKRR
jgi:hypothetical protein